MSHKIIEQYYYSGFTINKIHESCWVFIHDNVDVTLPIMNTSSCVESLSPIFAADTEQECIDEIITLGLNNPFSGTT